MRAKVIRGRNQRGISFTSQSSDDKHNVVAISFGEKNVFTDVRFSSKVPNGSLILDSRLFDELGCDSESEVEITSIDDEIPRCGKITLAVGSTEEIDADKIATAISKRVEEFEEHLDGLILKTEQVVRIPELKLLLVVKDLEPRHALLKVARVSWKHLLKIQLEEQISLGCFNLCCAIDYGVTSFKTEHTADDDFKSFDELASRTVTTLLSGLEMCKENPLFSSFVFSDDLDFYETFLPESGDKNYITRIDSASVSHAHNIWLSKMIETHKERLSNPGIAIKKALEITEEMRATDRKPTLVVLISNGAYTTGPNPVSIIRDWNLDGVAIFVIYFNATSDLAILEAIADVGGGKSLCLKDTNYAQTLNNSISHKVKIND
ncbi:MAG: hypothetical protein ACW97A_12045 [Candidatus Thorarchaeota archaeon]|jgi:hypothetical protein